MSVMFVIHNIDVMH
jgi:hypothetical protein